MLPLMLLPPFTLDCLGAKRCATGTHYQCSWANCRLSLLWNKIRGNFERFGFYTEGKGISQRQSGVFRVNCIDCLDRTNVVQCVLARHHLEYFLNKFGLLGDSGSLPRDYPKVAFCLGVVSCLGEDRKVQGAGTSDVSLRFDVWGTKSPSRNKWSTTRCTDLRRTV